MREWPSLFISHGAPTLLIEDSPTRRFLQGLGPALGRPRAILCISAHWETEAPAVAAGPRPETIHDFQGFPRPLREFGYPAPGDPDLALQIVGMLQAGGFRAGADPKRGLDHGAWVPLALMYPLADIPVVQLSIQPSRGAGHHIRLGHALAPLRQQDVLVLGSGSLTHNLGALRMTGEPEPWATEFDRWMDRVVSGGDLQELADYRGQAPGAGRAHPTDEHLLPLHVAAGAGGGPGTRLHDAFMFGSLSMAAYAFPGLANAVDASAQRTAVPL